ncbi:MAG: hypothetical protein ACK4S5_00060 [Sphingobium yanoikuyae]
MRRSAPTIHPIGCRCDACGPVARKHLRTELAIKAVIRVLFLTAALFAIPFIIAHAIASAKGENR